MSHPKRQRRSEIVVPHSPKWHQRLVAWLIWVVANAISATIRYRVHDPHAGRGGGGGWRGGCWGRLSGCCTGAARAR